MKNGLVIGKWALILLIWILVLLTATQSVDEMVIIKFSLGLFYTIIIVTIGFSIFNFAENPKAGFKFIASGLVLGLVGFISFQMSDDLHPITNEVVEGAALSEAGIYTFYVLIIAAVLAIVGSEAKRALKV